MQDLDWLRLCYLHFLLTARETASFITSRLQRLKFSRYGVLAAVNLSLTLYFRPPHKDQSVRLQIQNFLDFYYFYTHIFYNTRSVYIHIYSATSHIF
jgi:hypothetical protein